MLNDTLSRTAVSGCRRMEYTRLHGSEYHKMLCNVIFAAVDLIHGRTALTRHVAAERARDPHDREGSRDLGRRGRGLLHRRGGLFHVAS